MKRFLLGGLPALVLCAVLVLPQGALAAGFPDLPASNWACEDMSRAVELGILTGFEDGSIHPDGTLTWGQYLVMLCRAFYPESYASALDAGCAWDQGGYWAAWDNLLLWEGDFLPVTPGNLNAPILRQDAAALLSRVLPEEAEDPFFRDDSPGIPAGEAFSDWGEMAPAYQKAVEVLYDACIVTGRDDGTFGPCDTIRRADGTVLLIRTMDEYDDRRADQEETAACQPFTGTGTAKADIAEAVERGEASWEDFCVQPFWLSFQGENAQKRLLLFGDESKRRYDNEAEAAAHMTTVTIPTWKLDQNGEKYAAEDSLIINAAIAADVAALFTEIFNDPERFPIQNVGGYGWRGDSATGEHNCGTAIDINWEQNYQVRDGAAQAGSCWKPGENPYSIDPEGSVVRIFAEHGWSWGGDAWAEDTDPSVGYHDYMHFSYMGM